MAKGNDGALFRNENKEKGDKRPDYTGNITLDGEKKSLAAWLNTSEGGVKYMSLKVSEWRSKEPPTPKQEEPDDDIPF